MANEDERPMSPRAPMFDMTEMKCWSFYRAVIAEFVASLLLLYVSVATIIGQKKQATPDGLGLLIVAWAFGGMTFVNVHCISGTSGGFGNPAVMFALLMRKKASLNRAVVFTVAQCLGATCGVGLVKVTMKPYYSSLGGGANFIGVGYSIGGALLAEVIGTFVVVLSTVDAEKALAPFSAAFAVFTVHLAVIPITGAGINPARSFGAAVICNNRKVWDDQWLFWFGPFVGALAATAYHEDIVKSRAILSIQQFCNDNTASFRSDTSSRLPGGALRRKPEPTNPRSNPPNRPPRTHGAIPSTTSTPAAPR